MFCSDLFLVFMDEFVKEIDWKNLLIVGVMCCIVFFVDVLFWRWKCFMVVALNNV